jgi:hypothetical protein
LKSTKYFYLEYALNELYAGQGTLEDILALLPSIEVQHDFRTNKEGEGNILLRNKD